MNKLQPSIALVMGITSSAGIAAPPENSPYMTDRVNAYVNEQSAEAFHTVSEILCMVGQTKAENFINQGAYVALVDGKLCESNKEASASSDSGSQQSSVDSTPDYIRFTVDVTQADSNSPVQMKTWVEDAWEEEGYTSYNLIKVQGETTATPSSRNPMGLFQLNFAGYPADSNWTPESDTAGFKGFLSATLDDQKRPVLNFFEESQEFGAAESRKATLIKAPDGSGAGLISEQRDSNTRQFNIAFDDKEFLRDKGSEAICFDRNNYNNAVWSYGLYDAETGERASVNAGFSITVMGDNGEREHGWASYWGVWLPHYLDIGHGDTVTRQSDQTDFTLFKAGGKLIKNEKRQITLGDIKGIPFSWHSSNDFKEYQIEWNGTQFVKTGVMKCQDNGPCYWKNASGSVTFPDYEHSIHAWSNAVNANIQIDLKDRQGDAITLDNNSVVQKTSQTTVMPGDAVPASLSCFSDCLMADGSTEGRNYEDRNIENISTVNYTFDSTTMTLKQSNQPVVVQDSWQSHHGRDHGFFSGVLVDSNEFTIDALSCDWDSTQFCDHKIWEAETYYTWETGNNDWNQLTLLFDANNNAVEFDPPWHVAYTHTDGTKYSLEYAGQGNLHGIPGKCVDRSTNENVECGPDTHWIPKFNVANGATVEHDGHDYLVKWLGYEQRMQKKPTGCEALTLDENLTLPEASDWTQPSIGDKPAITDAPKVIGGILQ